MTVFFAANSAIAFVNPEGSVGSAINNRNDPAFTNQAMWMSEAFLCAPLDSVKTELWIHWTADMNLQQNSGPTLAGFNSAANRNDFYFYRSSLGVMQFYMWNGSAFVAIGSTSAQGEPDDVVNIDIHYVAHATEGMLEFYMRDELLFSAYNLNTSGFAVDEIRWVSILNSTTYVSQAIIADECTIGWRLSNSPVVANTESITVVGFNSAPVNGIVSGTTNLSLTALVDGIGSAPEENDYIVALYAVSSTVDRTLSITDGTNPYTLLGTELYANNTHDTNLRVAFKKMGSTPDTFVQFGPTGATTDAGVIAVMVLRNVDPTTFLDGTVTTTSNTNTGAVNPPAATPTTLYSRHAIVGASAHDGQATSYNNASALAVHKFFLGGTGANAIIAFMGLSAERTAVTPYDPNSNALNVNLGTYSNAGLNIPVKPITVAHSFSEMPSVATIAATSGKGVQAFASANAADQIIRAREALYTLPCNNFEVKAVTAAARMRRGDTGPQSANLLIRSRKTDNHKTDQAISPAIDSLNAVWETNPVTSAPWTVSDANLALAGVRSRT